MKNEKKKILVIVSETYNCNTSSLIVDDYDDIFALVEEDIKTLGTRHSKMFKEIIRSVKENGKYEDDDITLICREYGSVFGTTEIKFKYWSNDDILNRFVVTYIEMA